MTYKVYFTVNDNRGDKKYPLPVQSFSVVKVVNGVSVWERFYYTYDEAQEAADYEAAKQFKRA